MLKNAYLGDISYLLIFSYVYPHKIFFCRQGSLHGRRRAAAPSRGAAGRDLVAGGAGPKGAPGVDAGSAGVRECRGLPLEADAPGSTELPRRRLARQDDVEIFLRPALESRRAVAQSRPS